MDDTTTCFERNYGYSVKKIRIWLIFFADNYIMKKKDMEGDCYVKEI